MSESKKPKIKLVVIKGDSNDADYITFIEKINGYEEEYLSILKKVAKAIKGCSAHYNWPVYDGYDTIEETYEGVLTRDDIDCFNECFGIYDIHSIKSIQVIDVENIEDFYGKLVY